MKFVVAAVLIILATPCWAGFSLAPTFEYETFQRDAPESSPASRFGGGLLASLDLVNQNLALEAQGTVLYENTTFGTGDTFQETTYRGRFGPLWRFFNANPIHLGVRGGVQYDHHTETYVVTLAGQSTSTTSDFLTGYGGLQLEIVPASGIGLVISGTVYRDRELEKWMPELGLGIVFHTN